MSDRWSRYAPLTGVVFVGLLVAVFATSGSTPGVHSTGAHVISFYKAHHGEQIAGNVLGAVGVAFFLFFAATLRARLRRREGGEALAALAFGGAVLLAVGGAAFSALGFALADARNTLDPSAAQALNVLINDFFFPLAVGTCVFMIGNWLAIVRTGALPKWLGWVALPIGIAALTPAGFIVFLVLLAWSLIVSVLLYLQPDQSPASPAAESPSR
jgi:hypothetical protein